MIRILLVLTTVAAVSGCSSTSLELPDQGFTPWTSSEPFEAPTDPDYATSFTKGQFVRDLRPLSSPNTTDLRELALTLPILESNSPEYLRFVYAHSSSAVTAMSWSVPADGAQAPVLVERLQASRTGSQRIRLTITPIPMGMPLKAYRYVSELERGKQGWTVLFASKTQTWGEPTGTR